MNERTKDTESESGEFSTADMENAIIEIDNRICDLQSFDVSTITERGDHKIVALKNKINSTIADIWGHDTLKHRYYEIWSLDRTQYIESQPSPLRDVHSGHRKGINDAITELLSLKASLQ